MGHNITNIHNILKYRLFKRYYNMIDLRNISNYYRFKAYLKLLPI